MIGSGNNVDAPEGFTGKIIDNNVFLMWKNNKNSYLLNYLFEPEAPGYTLGNEGNELIGANKFTPNELTPYHGKYLTSVTTYLNYYDVWTKRKAFMRQLWCLKMENLFANKR